MSWSNPTPTPTMTTSMDCGCRFRFRRFRRTRLQFRSLLFGLLTFTIGVWEWDAPVVVLLLRSNVNSNFNFNFNSNFNRVQSLVVAFSPWPETLSRSRSRSRWTTKTLTKANTNAAVALLNHSLLPQILTGSSGESGRAFPTALCSQSSNNNENSDNENDNENDNDENNDNDEFFRRRNQHWVVLVDDEESIRYAVGDFLYDRGYEVTACADANSLLDLIALRNNNNNTNNDKNPSSNTDNSNDDPQPRLPDVIISDVRMPESDKNGYELVEFLRSGAALSSSSSSSLPSSSSSSLPLPPPLATERSKRYGASLRTVPIVLLTAKAMTDDRIKGYCAGADVVVPKPFSPEELVSILDNLIRLRQQRLRPDALLVSSSSSSSTSSSSSSTSTSTSSSREELSSSSSSIVQQHDLRKLKAELEEIRSIVEHNVATTVRKTDVVLTDKERTVVRLLSEGCSPREMARELLGGATGGGGGASTSASTSTSTIHKIVTELCERTGTESKTELVRWARGVGYI